MVTFSQQNISVHTNTSCEELQARYFKSSTSDRFKMFSLILIGVVILMHISNLILIVAEKKLHKAVYYLLLNLSISDIFTSLTVIVMMRFPGFRNYSLSLVISFYTASVLSTMGITLERYIRVSGHLCDPNITFV